jgi:hypothetical protein
MAHHAGLVATVMIRHVVRRHRPGLPGRVVSRLPGERRPDAGQNGGNQQDKTESVLLHGTRIKGMDSQSLAARGNLRQGQARQLARAFFRIIPVNRLQNSI